MEMKLRMNAYYYSFGPTGVEPIDLILSAVACAGKAYHYTEEWNTKTDPYDPLFHGDCPVDWIQHAATDAATNHARLTAQVAELKSKLAELEKNSKLLSPPSRSASHEF